MSLSEGARLGARRLRARSVRFAFGLGLAAAAGLARLEHGVDRDGAVDRALSGGGLGLALPLFVYFAVARVTNEGSLSQALDELARHGQNRRMLMTGLLVPTAALSAGFGIACGALVAFFARSQGAAGLAFDLYSSAWVGGVAGAAYAAALLGASAFGRRGAGRAWLLLLDFVLGPGTSYLALPWPKAHVRNLLGGPNVLGFSQFTALFLLTGMAFAFAVLGNLRIRR